MLLTDRMLNTSFYDPAGGESLPFFSLYAEFTISLYTFTKNKFYILINRYILEIWLSTNSFYLFIMYIKFINTYILVIWLLTNSLYLFIVKEKSE